MARKLLTLTEQLREAILSAPVTQYRLSKESGVPRETISKFVRGRRGLRLETADAIVAALKLRLVRLKETGDVDAPRRG